MTGTKTHQPSLPQWTKARSVAQRSLGDAATDREASTRGLRPMRRLGRAHSRRALLRELSRSSSLFPVQTFRGDAPRPRSPGADCLEHGPQTIGVPWANSMTRFTLVFKAHAIEVLENAQSTPQACELLKIGWATANRIIQSLMP